MASGRIGSSGSFRARHTPGKWPSPKSRRSPRLEKPASGSCHDPRTGGAGDAPGPERPGDEATGSAASVGGRKQKLAFILRRQTAARYSQGIWVKKLALPRPRPEAPKTLLEVLSRIREDPSYPARAADWLCTAINDRKSYSGFKSRCEAAWRGELSPDQLVLKLAKWVGSLEPHPFVFSLS